MDKITALIQDNGWTQLEAAKRCSVPQPRINELLRGRISRLSLDALVNIALALGSAGACLICKLRERKRIAAQRLLAYAIEALGRPD